MSIYATIREAKINGELVFVQGVPSHIDDVGPEWDWLGPRSDRIGWLRTVFVIDNVTQKGTALNHQQYQSILLHLTPEEYYATPWPKLRRRIARALKERG